jgi:hypothetical protein
MKPAVQAFKIGKYHKPSEALKKALDILRRPGRWVQGELARGYDEDGNHFSCDSKATRHNAEAFCALGCIRFINGPAQKSAEAFLREAGKQIQYGGLGYEQSYIDKMKATNGSIFHVNDTLGFKRTIEMFKLAIKKARAAGK